MLVYSEKITSRLQYISRLILHELLGIKFQIVSSRDSFENDTCPKLNYSPANIPDSAWIKPAGLLFETGIREQDIYAPVWKNKTVFFITGSEPDLPYDPFSAAFYLVTRYEEYLPHDVDEHGRYDPRDSIAYQNDFLDHPVVNYWALELGELLKTKYPRLRLKKRSFNARLTIDVDQPFALAHKSILRTLNSVIQAPSRLGIHSGKERLKMVLGKLRDPYDTYEMLHRIHQQYNVESVYFFQVGKHGKFDKNIKPSGRAYRNLITSFAKRTGVGLHPSYRSNDSFDILKQEYDVLFDIIGKPVKRSRQHFLRLKFPDTYRNLIRLGITEDYTMGFASEPGFRAGIADPFYFYDLEKDEQTGLKIFPFQLMDGTLNQYKELEPEEALSKIEFFVKRVRSVNGTFMSLWHNSSLSEKGEWEGWSMVYLDMIKSLDSI
ncbi:MAG: polysaccharide deacetylase family protein [Bacteroidales bacterium]|nr:polysaccharide deacetylase family protein [Bacteroidales bacterium]